MRAQPQAGEEGGAAAGGLRLEGLSFRFGGAEAAVDGVRLAVPAGAFLCLLGPSGCGKTTLLRLAGGYLAPAGGRVEVGGEDVTHLPPERRRMGMVFQSYALFPHLTARDNVAFGPRVQGLPRAEVRARTEELLELVRLSGRERDRLPRELSGGQQQRVALARALAVRPRVLLLDEPFANLDRRLREELRGEVRRLQRRLGLTTVLVTHDQEEALELADLVAVMRGGRVLQVAPPEQLYARPSGPFVARFVGEANLLRVEEAGPPLRLEGGLTLGASVAAAGGPVGAGATVLVRPEALVLGEAAAACADRFLARVCERSFTGADVRVRLAVAEGAPELLARARPGTPLPAVGERVQVGVPAGAAWVLPAETA
jgi:ABC-type Fe3+/spermidine/putrescine transport system ATPase subunit